MRLLIKILFLLQLIYFKDRRYKQILKFDCQNNRFSLDKVDYKSLGVTCKICIIEVYLLKCFFKSHLIYN